jgi:hypothetical protein
MGCGLNAWEEDEHDFVSENASSEIFVKSNRVWVSERERYPCQERDRNIMTLRTPK